MLPTQCLLHLTHQVGLPLLHATPFACVVREVVPGWVLAAQVLAADAFPTPCALQHALQRLALVLHYHRLQPLLIICTNPPLLSSKLQLGFLGLCSSLLGRNLLLLPLSIDIN